eukprot:1096200-Rhodomonas_salina.1
MGAHRDVAEAGVHVARKVGAAAAVDEDVGRGVEERDRLGQRRRHADDQALSDRLRETETGIETETETEIGTEAESRRDRHGDTETETETETHRHRHTWSDPRRRKPREPERVGAACYDAARRVSGMGVSRMSALATSGPDS